jgi:hypothetical protein
MPLVLLLACSPDSPDTADTTTKQISKAWRAAFHAILQT